MQDQYRQKGSKRRVINGGRKEYCLRISANSVNHSQRVHVTWLLRFHGDDCSIFMIEFENQNFGEFIDPNSAAGAAAATASTADAATTTAV